MPNPSTDIALVLRIDRRKSERWCDIGPGKFECSSDFLSCTHVNQYISSILHILQCENPQVCVIGDPTGAVVIPCLVQLKVGHACVVGLQDDVNNDLLARNINDCFRKTSDSLHFAGAPCGYDDVEVQTESATL